MRYDSPPERVTISVLNSWALSRLNAMNDADFMRFVRDEDFAMGCAPRFRPVGMPETCPRETQDYRLWKKWGALCVEAHQRATIAGRRAREFFEKAGVEAPSVAAVRLMVEHEMRLLKRGE